MASPPNLTEVEQRWYYAGERDGRAVGFWEGFREALKDVGLDSDDAERVEITYLKELIDAQKA